MENKNYSTVFEADLAYLRSLGDTSECKTEFEVRLKTLRKLGGDIQTTTPLLYEIEKKILDFLGGDSSLYDNIYFLRKAIAERQGVNTEGLQTIYAIAVASLNSKPVDVKYTITFKNYDGTILETQSLSLNEMPVYTGDTPVKPSDSEYNYTFNGWLPEISTVSGNAEYVAQYTATEIPVGPDLTLPYVTFTAEQANSTIGLKSKYRDHNLEYSTDTTNWNTMSTSTTITMANKGDRIYVRGILSRDNASSTHTTFKMTGKIAASGNCNAIWDYRDLNAPLKGWCGADMFYNCTSLTQAPELPATTLASSCYQAMFSGCTSLVEAPELPATTIKDTFCYERMFSGCTSLVEAPELPATTLADSCYSRMFSGCTSLVEAPELPATTLADYCYREMFYNCTSLTEAPELPATTLASSCYRSMFNGCTSLVEAPELPATELANYCYYQMFNYCTSLTTAPELPATELAESCYYQMFYSCTALTTAPELPATTLSMRCYYQMFTGCSLLVEAPILPATTLAYECYYEMFYNCTALKTAPELPATTLTTGCYNGMFYGCTSLVESPILPATILASSCYYKMFKGCSNLKKITCLATNISVSSCTSDWVTGVSPTGTFIKDPNMTDWTTGYDGIPSGWTVKNYGESDGPDLTLPYVTFTAEEANSTIGLAQLSTKQTLEYSIDTTNWNTMDTSTNISLPNIGDKVYIRGILSADNSSYRYTQFKMTGKIAASGNCNAIWNYQDIEAPLKKYCGYHMFNGCASLTTAPELPATTLADYCYQQIFDKCSSLTTAPELPATTLAVRCYWAMLRDCASLTTAPELPATELASNCYAYMFYGCSSLVEVPELPATELASNCYAYMFYGCSSLVEAPELPATHLHSSCYSHMFTGCSNLNKITCLATIVDGGSTDNWLHAVSVIGIFIKNPDMNDWETGGSGIPSGWTVEDYVG